MFFERGKIERAAVDARGSAGFEAADLEAERGQSFRGLIGRGLASAAGTVGEVPDVDLASEESAGGENHCMPAIGDTAFDTNALCSSSIDQ